MTNSSQTRGRATLRAVRRGVGQAFVAALASALALAPEARATSARIGSLDDNFLFLDDTDLFRFPAAAPWWAGIATLDFTPSPATGNAGVLFGRERRLVLGVWVNRPWRYDDVAEIGAIYGEADPPPVRKIADIVFAGRWAGRHALGLLLSPGYGIATTETDIGGDDRDDLATGGAALLFDASMGYSYGGPRVRSDTATTLGFHRLREMEDGVVVRGSGGAPSFALDHRTVGDLRRGLALGGDLHVAYRRYDLDDLREDVEGRYWRLVVRGDLGPRMRFAGGRVEIGVFGGARHEALGGDAPRTGPSLAALDLPRAGGAVEARVFRSWRLRGGAAYAMRRTARSSPEPVEAVAEVIERGVQQTFDWSLGLGFEREGFVVDAMVADALVLDGPDAVGGTAPGLFGMLSGAYRW